VAFFFVALVALLAAFFTAFTAFRGVLSVAVFSGAAFSVLPVFAGLLRVARSFTSSTTSSTFSTASSTASLTEATAFCTGEVFLVVDFSPAFFPAAFFAGAFFAGGFFAGAFSVAAFLAAVFSVGERIGSVTGSGSHGASGSATALLRGEACFAAARTPASTASRSWVSSVVTGSNSSQTAPRGGSVTVAEAS
jgi:hypothetical protein